MGVSGGGKYINFADPEVERVLLANGVSSDGVGLILRFQAEQASGQAQTALWYEGQQFTLDVADAIAMLYAIELYASACYDRTQAHLLAIDGLNTAEDVESYDCTTGYPEKIIF